EMDEYLLAVGVNTDSKNSLRVAASYLKGDARTWFHDIKKVTPAQELTNWEQLQVLLKSNYEPVTKDSKYLEKLDKLRYNGNIIRYNQRFNRYATLANMSRLSKNPEVQRML